MNSKNDYCGGKNNALNASSPFGATSSYSFISCEVRRQESRISSRAFLDDPLSLPNWPMNTSSCLLSPNDFTCITSELAKTNRDTPYTKYTLKYSHRSVNVLELERLTLVPFKVHGNLIFRTLRPLSLTNVGPPPP